MKCFIPLLVSALAASAAKLTITSGKVSLLSSDQPEAQSKPLDLERPLHDTLRLGPKDSLKLSFQIVEDGSSTGVQPHQVFLRLHDPVADEEGIIPLRVSPTGQVKFDLNMSKPPLSLPPTNSLSQLTATLILGSFTHTGQKYHLFNLEIPPSQTPPEHPLEHLYHPLKNISHTFRPEHKSPPKVISLVFSAVVLSPWLGLLVALTQIKHSTLNLASSSVLPFLALLTAFEALLFRYWIGLKLPQILLYGGVLGVVTLGAGKSALSSLSRKRLGL